MADNEIFQYFGEDPFIAAQALMEAHPVWENWGKEEHIALKPNLVVSQKSSLGATTHPSFCAGVLSFLQDKGFRHISIMEGSWVGDRTERAFKICGYTELSKKYGVPLVDLQKDESVMLEASYGEYRVCRSILEADRLINLPVLKGHCQTYMTCALKNLKGCIPDSEKRRYHSLGLHRPIADLNELIHCDLILVDALEGDPDFEEGGNPCRMNLFLASSDPVLIDSYACTLLGVDQEQVEYISNAQKLGLGSLFDKSCSVKSLNKGENLISIQRSGAASQFNSIIEEDSSCSACYASLIQALVQLDEEGTQLKGPVYIGQAYRGKSPNGQGIGDCLKSCQHFVRGCPPSALQIKEFLT